MNKIIFWVAVLSVLWIAVASYYQPENQTTAAIGSAAPDFSLPTINGRTLALSDAKGKPLVINFWNSWCPPCQEETPVLDHLYHQYKGEFQLYGINNTSNDTVGAVKLFLENYHVDYPVLLDKSGEITRKYGVRGMPTTFLIDRNGKIVGKIVGYQGKEVLKKRVLSLLSK
ncbi:MAG TPA: TlpA disulfide reductase family protein [Bacillales bacterium]|nr:TlpA disulfide reductase family protein [Bacillales bacterium]